MPNLREEVDNQNSIIESQNEQIEELKEANEKLKKDMAASLESQKKDFVDKIN